MLKNQELLDLEIDFVTGEVCIVDAPDARDPLLASLGFGGPARDATVTVNIGSRRLSRGRDDIDRLCYRALGSTERWEDINFYDNDWDGGFRAAVLTHDYERLASCSPLRAASEAS